MIAPARNEADIEDIPEHLRNDIDLCSWTSRRGARVGARARRAAARRAVACSRAARGYRIGTGLQATPEREQWQRRRRRLRRARLPRYGRPNPYVQRVVEDEELRENLATPSSREEGVRADEERQARHEGALDDKKLQRELRRRPSRCGTRPAAARGPEEAASAARGLAKLLFVGIVGAGASRSR